MTTDADPTAVFWRSIYAFVEHLATQVQARWAVWAKGHEMRHVHEVIGGLLARQATLAAELALNPGILNQHSAPLFLRPMVENCIILAWILKQPDYRANQFISYGLGQEVLLLEHAKADARERGIDPEEDSPVMQWEQWITSQRYPHLTEVNVGSWGPNLREMAEEVGLEELHRSDYVRYNSAIHNMWHHVVRFNIDTCRNPLHGYHRVPVVRRLMPEFEFLQRAAEYVDKAIEIFDEATGTKLGDDAALHVLDEELQKIPSGSEQGTDGRQ